MTTARGMLHGPDYWKVTIARGMWHWSWLCWKDDCTRNVARSWLLKRRLQEECGMGPDCIDKWRLHEECCTVLTLLKRRLQEECGMGPGSTEKTISRGMLHGPDSTEKWRLHEDCCTVLTLLKSDDCTRIVARSWLYWKVTIARGMWHGSRLYWQVTIARGMLHGPSLRI